MKKKGGLKKMLSDHWGVIRSDPRSIRAVLQWKCFNILGNFAISGSQSDVVGLRFPEWGVWERVYRKNKMEKNFCEGFLETGFLCFKTLPYIWRISTVTFWIMGSIVLLVRKQWNLDFSFLKGSSNAALLWGEGISENIHWRFLSWLKCRFQDMSEESVLNLLGQYFNGIYLVKAIHSQNSVIQAGFC